jgi:peptidoglycan hydrolase-like protein with peptidoglycan-binding domain
VPTQTRADWRLLPLWVGPQASCTTFADRMSNDITTAGNQGVAEADAAVAGAQALGLGRGTTLYYDLESYDLAPDDCRQPALAFLSGWTERLDELRYRSGVYSSISAAIDSLDFANDVSHGSYTMPDDIWFAWANGQADTSTVDPVKGDWLATSEWDDHQRIHQYQLDVVETYAGATVQIDRNWVDVGGGSTDSARKPLCKGVDVDLRRYPNLSRRSRGDAVAAAQCLLRTQHFGKPATNGRYDARTVRAVEKAQRKLDLKVTGKVTKRTWVALLARGSQPLLKVGSTGLAVHRLQRALNAALGKKIPVDGVLSSKTAKAVTKIQKRAHLEPTGNVDPATWQTLVSGG